MTFMEAKDITDRLQALFADGTKSPMWSKWGDASDWIMERLEADA